MKFFDRIKGYLFLKRYGRFQGNPREVAPRDWDQVVWEDVDPLYGEKRMAQVLDLIPPGGLHLDVGTGAGDGTRLAGTRSRCVGMDYGLRSARLAAQKGVAVLQGDARRLPFGDGLFDSVTCMDVLEHIPGAAQVLTEIARVLKTGGKLILTTPTSELLGERVARWGRALGLVKQMQPYDLPYSRHEVVAMIGKAGLVVADSKTIPNWVPSPVLRLLLKVYLYECIKPEHA